MAPLRTLTLTLALGLALSGCGKDQTVQRRLGDDTADVVSALNAKDVTAAGKALSTLDADIAAAGRLEQLSATQVTALRAGVRTLRADLALLAPVVLPTPTPVRTSAPTRTGGHKKRHGKGGEGD